MTATTTKGSGMDPDVKAALNQMAVQMHLNDNRILTGVLEGTLLASNAEGYNTANQTPHANDVPAASK